MAKKKKDADFPVVKLGEMFIWSKETGFPIRLRKEHKAGSPIKVGLTEEEHKTIEEEFAAADLAEEEMRKYVGRRLREEVRINPS